MLFFLDPSLDLVELKLPDPMFVACLLLDLCAGFFALPADPIEVAIYLATFLFSEPGSISPEI